MTLRPQHTAQRDAWTSDHQQACTCYAAAHSARHATDTWIQAKQREGGRYHIQVLRRSQVELVHKEGILWEVLDEPRVHLDGVHWQALGGFGHKHARQQVRTLPADWDITRQHILRLDNLLGVVPLSRVKGVPPKEHRVQDDPTAPDVRQLPRRQNKIHECPKTGFMHATRGASDPSCSPHQETAQRAHQRGGHLCVVGIAAIDDLWRHVDGRPHPSLCR